MTAPRRLAGVFVRGMAMGVAEVVPGVSGGTIAFVTGIYEELVTSIARFSLASIGVLARDPARFWREYNLVFLVTLASGMLLAVVLFARAMSMALATYPTLVWGFFFGLIAASVVLIGRARSARLLATLGVAGALAGFAITQLTPGELEPTLLIYFAGGALAVCAWILPAVSGSFLLLVIGLYQPVLEAVARFDLVIVGTFVLGCAAGLMVFARVLVWVMGRHREWLLSFLTGFMVGAMVKLWPWRLDEALLGPAQWSAATGEPAHLAGTLASVIAGAAAIWMLARLET